MKSLILTTGRYGKAVLANRRFAKGERILECKAPLVHADDVPNVILTPEDDRYLQVGPDIYQGPSGDLDDYVNHSCDPNAGLVFVGGKVILTAIKNVLPGEEITFDYSTTMDDPHNWEMECMCGSPKCRVRIGNFKDLPRQVQVRYIRLGIVPDYCIKAMRQKELLQPRIVLSIPRT
jgi:hypothetical protein